MVSAVPAVAEAPATKAPAPPVRKPAVIIKGKFPIALFSLILSETLLIYILESYSRVAPLVSNQLL